MYVHLYKIITYMYMCTWYGGGVSSVRTPCCSEEEGGASENPSKSLAPLWILPVSPAEADGEPFDDSFC